MFDTSAFAQGLVLGLGLFICPGPKDVLILRQALLRRPAIELVAVGTLSDAILIIIGMAGASAALSRAPQWQTVALGLGVCVMLAHGLSAARRAFVGAAEIAILGPPDSAVSRARSLGALLLISFVNLVTWLDTILVIGTLGAALPEVKRVAFACGAVAASFAWFVALVMGAQSFRRWMSEPRAWRALDAFVAVAMLGLAAYVAMGLLDSLRAGSAF